MNHKHSVTLFHDSFEILSPLFKEVSYKKYPSLGQFYETFSNYDLVLVENDNSEKAWTLIRLRQSKKLLNLIMLFPTKCPKAFEVGDITFNSKLCVAKNLQVASQKLLNDSSASLSNGLTLSKDLVFQKNSNRILIHPSSKDPKRNWSKEKFYSLSKQLMQKGYRVYFTISKQEQKEFKEAKSYGIKVPEFSDFLELASFMYESGCLIGNDSGLGHLASNVGIPTVTISGNPKRVRLWRPGFSSNQVVTLRFDLPNFKGIRLKIREDHWQRFISVSRVIKKFDSFFEPTKQQNTI